jgi:hypothetical protein
MGSHHRPNEGASNTWLTPPEIVKALGPFDLDPCAATGQPWSTATTHYTELENGLTQPWRGRVWLNPPYGPHVWAWLDRLAQHGDGIALVFARTETVGFQRAARCADAVLFLAGRLHFYRVNGIRAAANAGAPSCFIAFGEQNVQALRLSGLPGFIARPQMIGSGAA